MAMITYRVFVETLELSEREKIEVCQHLARSLIGQEIVASLIRERHSKRRER